MGKNDFIENIIGGIFAVIAVIAAVVEMIVTGISTATVVACIKDVFGTLAVVVLFFAIVKDMFPKIKFEDRLNAALDTWQNENRNMIVRKTIHDVEHKNEAPSCFSLDLKTDVSDFYKPNGTTSNTGLFLRMPMIKKENYKDGVIVLKFYLNKGTFFSDKPKDADLTENYNGLIELFSELFNNKHGGFAVAEGKGQEIHVTINKPVRTNQDIQNLIEVINTMYTAYLVSANLYKA